MRNASNDQSLFERILIYVYLKLFSRDGARDPWTATDPRDGATRIMIQNHVITPKHVRTRVCPLGCAHGMILFNPHSGMKKGGKRLCG